MTLPCYNQVIHCKMAASLKLWNQRYPFSNLEKQLEGQMSKTKQQG